MESGATEHASPIWADQTDAVLMVYMAMAADEPSAARTAWEAFYRRHVDYLHAVCLRSYRQLLGAAGVADLVADTFKRAYERAESFDDGGLNDSESLRRRARAWLGRIAHRLVLTTLRGRSVKVALLEQDHWQQVSRPACEESTDPKRLAALREAVDSLSQREQMVIWTTFQWYEPDRPHQRLPNDVAADLARTLQTTPENLRQLRRRAMTKIKSLLQADAADGAES